MAFCRNCGSVINEQDRFCVTCGAEQNINTFNAYNNANKGGYTDNSMLIRESTLEDLRRIFNYFNQKRDVYKEYYDSRNQAEKAQSGKSVKLIVFGIIVMVLGINFILLNIYLLSLSARLSNDLSYISSIKDIIVTILFVLFFPSLCIIPGIIMINAGKKRNARLSKTFEEKNARANALAEELTEFYQNYGPCQIGQKYAEPVIIERLYEFVSSGRAYTIQEAINMIVEDQHRSIVEYNTQMAAEYAKEAAYYAARR